MAQCEWCQCEIQNEGACASCGAVVNRLRQFSLSLRALSHADKNEDASTVLAAKYDMSRDTARVLLTLIHDAERSERSLENLREKLERVELRTHELELILGVKDGLSKKKWKKVATLAALITAVAGIGAAAGALGARLFSETQSTDSGELWEARAGAERLNENRLAAKETQVFECGMWRFADCDHVPIDQVRCLGGKEFFGACKGVSLFPENEDTSKAIDCRKAGQTAADVTGPDGVLSLALIRQTIGEVDLCGCRCVSAYLDQTKPYGGEKPKEAATNPTVTTQGEYVVRAAASQARWQAEKYFRRLEPVVLHCGESLSLQWRDESDPLWAL